MDALADVLSLLKAQSYTCAGFDMGEGHSMHMPAHPGIFCYAIVSGEMWLSLSDGPMDVRLQAGDCVILPKGRSFVVTSTLGALPMDAAALIESQPIQSITTYRGGGKCFAIGCHFLLADNHSDILLNLLAPIVHITAEAGDSTLHWALDCMRQELHAPQPGGSLIVDYMANLILIKALRLHLAQDGIGWLFALSDTRMKTAISVMHADPANRWTVNSLAEQAGMSRTRFAVRFKQLVGMAPLDYLRRWRMLLASNKLIATNDLVSEIALSLGYDSESAFSTAFRKVMSISPRGYRQSHA